MPVGGHLIVGEIRKAHGIKGECFVMPATDDVAGVYAKGRELFLGDADGRVGGREMTLAVAAARPFKGGLIVRFEDVHDRNASEMLRGRTLLIRSEDARPLEPGQYFIHDLNGLEVVELDGAPIGRVAQIYEIGTSLYLSVDDGERERMIPFTEQFVREVDIEGRRVVIEVIPGLLEL
jgi:16S rRNA processing protein RimM